MRPAQQILFTTPDWEEGYGVGLLTQPPRERLAWYSPDDRDGLTAMLLTCARETIAAVGWCEALSTYSGPKRSPLLWRATPTSECRWAGHVWDARTVGDDPTVLLRLMVLFVDWRYRGNRIWGDFAYSRLPREADPTDLQPHLSPYADDCEYCLIEGSEIDRPLDIQLAEGSAVPLEAWTIDDRIRLERVLHETAVSQLNEGNSWWVWSKRHSETDSHFARWYALEMQRLEAKATRLLPTAHWNWEPDQLPLHRAAYERAMAAGEVPAELPSTIKGYAVHGWTEEFPFGHVDVGATFARLTVTNVFWDNDRVAHLDYVLEPRRQERDLCTDSWSMQIQSHVGASLV